MPLMPGADPILSRTGDTGAVLVHGFGSTPQSMAAWAEHLADHGISVHAPRLPGHGTSVAECNRTQWEDWFAEVDRAHAQLRGSCTTVFVMGQAMGATLALRLAEVRSDVAGLVLVNPAVSCTRAEKHLLPLLGRVTPVWPRTSDELRRPGAVEQAYVRTPVRAAQSMTRLRRIVRADLGRVEQPTLIFTSRTDPIVDPADSGYVLEHISSRDRHQEILEQSGHTATLDLDAESIFSHSRKFVERLRR